MNHHHSLKGCDMEGIVAVILAGVVGIVMGMVLLVVVRIVWMWWLSSSDYD